MLGWDDKVIPTCVVKAQTKNKKNIYTKSVTWEWGGVQNEQFPRYQICEQAQ